MRIVLLGGTGYLGSQILQQLEYNKHDILCITRQPEKYTGDKNIEYCNLLSAESRIRNFRPEIFFSAVGRYLKGEAAEWEVMEANFEVPGRILQACVMAGAKRGIAIGTALPDDFNMYTFSKKLLADLGQWYAGQRRIEFINVRLEMFYGIGEPKERFLPWAMQKMFHGEDVPLTCGTQRRDMIYIEDVVDNVCSLLETDMSKRYADIPLGTGEAPSIREVIEYLYDLTGSHPRLLFGEVPMRLNEPDTVADKKEMNKWGLKTRYSWREGLNLLIQHERKQQGPDKL